MDNYNFDDNLRSIDWSRDLPEPTAQVPTTDRLTPPPPKDNSNGSNDE